MKSKGKARGVVMFVDEDNLKQLLSVLEMMIDRGNNDLKDHFWLVSIVVIAVLIEWIWRPSLNYRFVASDSWGKKTSVVSGRERLTLGAITIAPKQRTIDGQRVLKIQLYTDRCRFQRLLSQSRSNESILGRILGFAQLWDVWGK